MTARSARVIGCVVGVATMAGGGAFAGGWWWLVALVGGGAAVAGVSGRRAGLVLAVATLALTAGAVAADAPWVAAVLVVGVVVSLELAAGADRSTRVRPAVPPPGRDLVPALAAAPVVLLASELSPGATVPLTLLAVVAGATLLLVTTVSR